MCDMKQERGSQQSEKVKWKQTSHAQTLAMSSSDLFGDPDEASLGARARMVLVALLQTQKPKFAALTCNDSSGGPHTRIHITIGVETWLSRFSCTAPKTTT